MRSDNATSPLQRVLLRYTRTAGKRPMPETGATDPALAGQLLEAVIMHLQLPNLDGKRVLDFGAGRGAMALELKRRDADVVCVEPFGCEYLARLGISTYTDLVDLPPTLRLDGIVCLEV